MVQEKKIRWGLVIAVLFFAGLAIDYFFLHILFQEKLKEQHKDQQKQEEMLSPSPTPEASPAENLQSTPNGITTQEPKAEGTTKGFQEKTRQCLGAELAKNPGPDQLLLELEKLHPVTKTQFQLENTHIQLPDGSQRRLHLISADSTNSKNAKELRYFKLDAEGLPERIDLKPEETINPKPEFISSLKNQGKVIYHQLKETKTLNDGTSMILTTINGKAYEFQIFTKGKTLSCRSFNCACR